LARGLAATAAAWPPLRPAYAWVVDAATILANAPAHAAAQVEADFTARLARLSTHAEAVGPLAEAVAHFLTVSASYRPGLVACSAVPGLPATNHALAQVCGAVREHERRATGRKGARPGLVVRGAVRLVASLATRLGQIGDAAVMPRDLARWRRLRRTIEARQAARGRQRAFRRDPTPYLDRLEPTLLTPVLPA
jgi:hypothetical protein